MMLEIPEKLAEPIPAAVEGWTAELLALRRDPTVRKFLELQDKIDESYGIGEGPRPSLSVRTRPYDLYDVFEFAWDLAGRHLAAQHVARLARGRFPETSSAGRQAILRFLVANGYAEVTRRTASGRPASYRFTPPQPGGTARTRSGLGVPPNELSRIKAEDLEDVVGFPPADRERR